MFTVHHGQSLVSDFFFEVSINRLFDSLESGKRNYSFGKRLEIVLNFAFNDCRNPDIKSITFHQI